MISKCFHLFFFLTLCHPTYTSFFTVCYDYTSYLLPFSKNCRYNPDIGSTPSEIVLRYGFPFESYSAVTEDGYQLQIFRIPPKSEQARPVFLQHGLFLNGLMFLALGNESLAFQLSNQGFDVWIGNFRGTLYSNRHLTLKHSEQKYWDFSFYELGKYDLSAMLDVVSEKNLSKKKTIYIGFSLGTLSSWIYSVTNKTAAAKNIEALIGTAPTAYFRYNDEIQWKLLGILQEIARLLGFYGIGMTEETNRQLFTNICLYSPARPLCYYVQFLLLYLFTGNVIQPEMLPILLNLAPSGVSDNTVKHFRQLQKSGRFEYFDYGPERNVVKYGSVEPTQIDETSIELPVHILYGKKDTTTVPKDVELFYNNLKTKKSIYQISDFNHLDFYLNPRKQKDFNDVLFKVLDELN